jgi:hypothetical protein
MTQEIRGVPAAPRRAAATRGSSASRALMGAVARPRDTVNLRGRPKARRDQAGGESRPWPGPAVPGRVTPRRDATMDYLQPSPTAPRGPGTQFNDSTMVGPACAAGLKTESGGRRNAPPRERS